MAFVVATSAVILFVLLQIPIALLALVGVYKLRNAFPLSGRELGLLVPQWVYLLTGTIYYPVSGLAPEVPCSLILVFELGLFSFSLHAVLLRCFRLLFLYFSAQALMKRHKKPHRNMSTWYVDHRHFVTRRFLLKVLALWTFLMTTAMVVLFAAGPESDFGLSAQTPCPTIHSVALLTQCEGLLVLILLVATALRLRGIDDAYHIGRELKFVAIGSILTAVSRNLQRRFQTMNDLDFPVMEMVIAVCLSGTLAATTYFPLYLAAKEGKIRARRHSRVRRFSMRKGRKSIHGGEKYTSASNIDTAVQDMGSKIETPAGSQGNVHSGGRYINLSLRAVLLDIRYEELRHDFERHLSSEFAFENLLFWAEAGTYYEQYEQRTNGEIAQHAVALYNEFVKDGAPFQANFNHKLKKAIKKSTQTALEAYARDNPADAPDIEIYPSTRIERDVFEVARATVYKLMAQGAYIRWQVKHREVLTDFLAKHPIPEMDVTSPPGSPTDSNTSLMRSVSYSSITRSSYTSIAGPSSTSRPRPPLLGSSSTSFAPEMRPRSFSPAPLTPPSQIMRTFDFPDPPSAAASGVAPKTPVQRMATHARGMSDGSNLGFSETSSATHRRGMSMSDGSNLGFSETMSAAKHARGISDGSHVALSQTTTAATHARGPSDGSNLGFTETSTALNSSSASASLQPSTSMVNSSGDDPREV